MEIFIHELEGISDEEEAMFTGLASLMIPLPLKSWSSWGKNKCV